MSDNLRNEWQKWYYTKSRKMILYKIDKNDTIQKMILYKIDKNDRGRKVLFFYHEKIDSVHSVTIGSQKWVTKQEMGDKMKKLIYTKKWVTKWKIDIYQEMSNKTRNEWCIFSWKKNWALG